MLRFASFKLQNFGWQLIFLLTHLIILDKCLLFNSKPRAYYKQFKMK